MKKINLFFLFLCTSLFVFAQNNATDYNDMIIDEQMKIGTEIGDFVNSEIDALDLNYNILVKQVDASIASIQKLGAWQGDASFQTSALKLFGFYKSIIENEYKECLGIMKKPDAEFTDADMERMLTLEAEITEKEKPFDDDFLYTQNEFAKRWGFELIPYEEEPADY